MGIRVCIGNYGYYNEGELRDRWITLPKTDEKIQAFLKDNGLQDPLHEEIYISDYDGIPFDMNYGGIFNEYTLIDDLNLLAKQLELHPGAEEVIAKAFNTGIDIPTTMTELLNLVEQVDEIPFYSWPDNLNYKSPEERLAYAEIDTIGGIENLDKESLRQHFNHESYGRTLDHSGYTIGEYGYLDNTIGEVDTEYYSEQELIEEAQSKGFDDEYRPTREEMISDFKAVGFTYVDNFDNYDLRTLQAVHYLIDDISFDEGCALELYSDHMSAMPTPIEIGNAVLQVADIAYHQWPDNGFYSSEHERLAYAEIDAIGDIDVLSRDTLEQFFDYESYGQELEQDFYLGDEGYMSATAGMPDLDYYSYAEIKESIEQQWVPATSTNQETITISPKQDLDRAQQVSKSLSAQSADRSKSLNR